MTKKQQWLLDRLLIPAGILPPILTPADFPVNESLRQKIGNCGFEYFYTVKQNPDLVNSSVIGGKILAMHAPWPKFTPARGVPTALARKTIENRVFAGNRHSQNFPELIQSSFDFAQKIGAKVITTHITHLDHNNLTRDLLLLSDLEKKYKIKACIEPEGDYMYIQPDCDPSSLRKINGNLDWVVQPQKLVAALKMLCPQRDFKLTLDSASLINSGLPVVDSVRNFFESIGHVHLANNPVGGWDVATEINNPENVDFVNFLYDHNYQGLVTAEIGPTNGNAMEELIGKVYGLSSLFGFKFLKNVAVANAQSHIQRSCQYLLENID